MKSTKTALLTSFTSLLLCFAMLLGTTFAWFTDTVTSGVNQIVAGNLDVELYHKSKNVSEEKVTSETANLFKDITLWEPGAYSYETFTVKNEGTLALKYKMALNVAAFTSYNGHDLTEVLKVATLNSVPASRADITGGVALKDWSLDASNVTLLPGGSKTFTVAVYWEPTDHDNDFNMNNGRPQPLSVDLGVTLLATQVEHESDSFDNQYDAGADVTLPEAAKAETAMASAVVVANEPTVFVTNNTPAEDAAKQTKVTFDAGALTDGATYKLTAKTYNALASAAKFEISTTAGADKNAVAAIDLTLLKQTETGEETVSTFTADKTVIVETYITKNLQNAVVTYVDTAFTEKGSADLVAAAGDYFYEGATGRLVFCTNHFSEYLVGSTSAAYIKETDTAYDTFENALDKANTMETPATVVMLNDCRYATDGSGLWNITNSVTLEGMGHSLDGYGSRIGKNTTLAINNNGTKAVDVTLKNLTINNAGAEGRAIETRGNIRSVNLEKVTINATGSGNTQGFTVGGNQSSSAIINVKDSKINAGNSGYPIITFNPVQMDIQGSELHGYCALYLKGVVSSAGSRGSVITAKNSNFDAPNVHGLAGGWNTFGNIVLEDDGISVTLDSCVINAKQENTALQDVFVLSGYAERVEQKCTFIVKGNSTEIGSLLRASSSGWSDKYSLAISGGTFGVDPSDFVATGYKVVDNGNGTWTVVAK